MKNTDFETIFEQQMKNTIEFKKSGVIMEPKIFKIKNYECEIRQIPEIGHYCAYVSIPNNHPFNDLHYDEVIQIDERFLNNIHGGLTFSDKNKFGIDFAHMGDYTPTYNSVRYIKKWTIKEIEKEMEKMVELFEENK